MGKYQGYEKYKDSGVEWLGEIPEHWGVKRLRYIGSCQDGISKGADYFGHGYPFVNYTDVYANLELPKTVIALANSTDIDKIIYSVKEGDIFFTRTSETIEEIGITSTCLTSIDNATFSGFLIRVRPFYNLIIPGFSKYYFRCQLHRFFFVKEMNLVTRASLSQELLKKLPVLLPPLEEQKAIAHFLDHKTKQIDDLIAKKEALIEKLDEKRTALISHAVTKGLDPSVPMKDSGVEWLGEIPIHWDKSLLKRYFNVELGKMLDSSKIPKNGILKPYLRAANIHWNSIITDDVNKMFFSNDKLYQYFLKTGDLLVTEGGVTVGRSAIWNQEINECYYQNSINRVRTKDCNSITTYFLYYWIYFMKNNGYIDLSANIATFGHLTQEKLQVLPIVIPPLEEQNKLIKILNSKSIEINLQKAKIQEAIERLKEYRTALITNAVTGKIDIRQVPIP